MTSSRLINFDRTTVMVFVVLFASVIANVLIKCGLDLGYMRLSFDISYDINNVTSYSTSILYILFTRLKQLIFIILLIKMINADVIYNLIIMFFGFIFGIFATIQTFYNGLTGIIELMLFLLPHYIFYMVLIHFIYKHYKNWSKDSMQFVKIIFLVVLFCAGVVSEGLFSRIFLENFYQHIVMKM